MVLNNNWFKPYGVTRYFSQTLLISPLAFSYKRLLGGCYSLLVETEMNNEKLILFAEDSVQDRSDITRSFKESETCTQLRFVEDGEDLMNYLCNRKGYTSGNAPSPDLTSLI